MTDIAYRLEPGLGADEFVDVLKRSTLAERRPLGDPTIIAGMLAHADLTAPKAETYYPHIGMQRHTSCWKIDRR